MRLLIPAIALSCVCLVGFQAAPHPKPKPKGKAPAKKPAPKPALVTFEQVKPILEEHCVGCHGESRPREGVNLTTYESTMRGGREGAIVKAGDPENSLLVQVLHGTHGAPMMPPRGGPIEEKKIKTIESWVKSGAKNTPS